MKLNLILFLIASSILAVIHITALELFLYWQFSWLDIPVHFLGGAVVALGIFAAAALQVPFPRRYINIVPVVSCVLIVALLWEIYQLFIGIPIEADFEIDSSIDVIMGVLGGCVGYFIGKRVQQLDN